MIDTKLSKSCKSSYELAVPFPHIIFDDFIPADIATQIFNELKSFDDWWYDSMLGYPKDEQDSQVKKHFIPGDEEHLIKCQQRLPLTWKTLEYFHSKPFRMFLEELTGIKGLMVDNTFRGSGVHKIEDGVYLRVHSDFNQHPTKPIWRRINLLLYLTPNWEYNGELDLYNKDPFVKVKSITPLFNRAVIFNTTDDALHGHPTPLECPEDVERYSFALYYYTLDRPENEKSDSKGAIWYKT